MRGSVVHGIGIFLEASVLASHLVDGAVAEGADDGEVGDGGDGEGGPWVCFDEGDDTWELDLGELHLGELLVEVRDGELGEADAKVVHVSSDVEGGLHGGG